LSIKEQVNRALEQAKKEKLIGASLEASVTLYVSNELAEVLSKLEDELRFVLITSVVNVKSIADKPSNAFDSEVDGLFVEVSKVDAEKCERCWHYSETVGQHLVHKDLCHRCVENVEGEGEVRKFA
jgi:isoleucyl-tRNA synthetase